jgi:surfeit locus 1 family protein
VHVVTPLRLDGRAEAVLVNRGFVPANDATTPEVEWDRPETGAVRGLAFLIPSVADSGTPLTREGRTSWRRLDLATVQARLPYPVLEVYLHQTERDGRAEGSSPWPIPARLVPLDDGPHLYYMVQWFLLAGASVAFGVIFVLKREGEREGGREKERQGG